MRNLLRCRAALAAAVIVIGGCDLLTSPQARLQHARQDETRGDYHAAMIELKNVLQAEPRNATAWRLAAEASLQLGDPESAAGELAAARRYAGSGTQLAVLQAKIALARGNPTALLKAIDAGSIALSENDRAVYRGRALLALRRVNESEAAFRYALRLTPSSVGAEDGLAESMIEAGHLDDALGALRRARSIRPDDATSWYLEGIIDGRRGRFTDMERALLQAKQYARTQLAVPQQGALLSSLIEARLALGDVEAAGVAYGRLRLLLPAAAITHLVGARVAIARQNYGEAEAELTPLLNTHPNLVQAQFLLGSALYAEGSLNRAEKHLEKVIELRPTNIEARKLLAETRLRLGVPDKAIAALTPAMDSGTDRWDLEALLAEAQMQAGDDTAAITQLERSVARQPSNHALQLLLATAYSKQRLTGKALAEVSRITADPSLDVRTLNAAAKILVSQGEYERADALLQRSLRLDSSNGSTRLELAEIEMRQGDDADAEKQLVTLCQVNASAIPPRLLLAQVYFRERKASDASLVIKQLLNLAPGRADVLNAIGLLYMQTGSFDQALGEFRAAADADPTNAGYWVNIARTHLALNRPQAAADAADEALTRRPELAPGILIKAASEIELGKADQALASVTTAERARPTDPALAEVDGDVRLFLKQYAEASQSYDRAVALGGHGAVAFKSYLARHAGKLPDTTRPLEQWLERHPNDVAIRARLGAAYIAQGSYKAARQEYEWLQAAGATDATTLNNLAWLYQRAGDSRALEFARRAYALKPSMPAVADTYGWALVQAGRLDDGLKILSAAAAADRSDQDIEFHYAAALARHGERERARTLLSQALASKSAFSERSDAERLLGQL